MTVGPTASLAARAAVAFGPGWWGAVALLVVMLVPLAGCTRPVAPPRSRDEIFQDRLRVPTLYISEKSGKRIVTEGGRMNFVDTESGEVCWVAWACRAPNCPGRGPDGEPFLCIEADMGYFAKPDGTVGYDPKLSAMTPKRVGMCPQCSVIRKPESETPEQAIEYSRFVQLHQLPEAAARIKQLDEEMARRVEWDRQHAIVGRAKPAGSAP